MNLAENFEEILLAFNKVKLDYLIVGGYAVIFHGYGRTTGDLDIWVNPTVENQNKLNRAFKILEMPTELVTHIDGLDFTKPFAVKLGEAPIQVDVFNAITGVSYNKAVKNSIKYKISKNLESMFIHLHELIVNKLLTGRLKDQADVDELQKINKIKNKK